MQIFPDGDFLRLLQQVCFMGHIW